MQKIRLPLLLSMTVLCVCLVGCARTQATRYYTLSPMEASPEGEPGRSALAIGVGPVVVPEYMDRPQMMTMAGPNELGFSEFHRWAEPLEAMLTRTLKENLAVLLGTEHVSAYPWPGDFEPDVVVAVEILRFGPGPDGAVVLDARWLAGSVGDPGPVQRTTVGISAGAGDYAAIAAAAGRAVADLSREIAASIGPGGG
jgi:uncharacterized lipoprotein YmbA